MRQERAATRLSIYISGDDTWQHKPLHHEIVRRARAAGLAGATVLRGTEGYGTSSRVHTTRLLDLAEGLPVVVIIVDEDERVRSFLPELDELIAEGTVLIDRVEAHQYGGERGS